MNQKINVLTVRGKANIKGFVKNGLDSSCLINVILCFNGKFEEFRNRGLTFPPHLFYYHEVSHKEVIGVLINKCNFTKEDAFKAMKNIIKECSLEEIRRIEDIDEQYEKLVESANNRITEKFNDTKLKIGRLDIIIIAGFLKEQINFVHSGDRGFLRTCEELGLNTIPIPKKDVEKEKQLKEWLKKRKKP